MTATFIVFVKVINHNSFSWLRHISRRYVKEARGALVGDSQCERLPVEVCGAGCTFEEGPEDCHEKVEQGDFPQLGIKFLVQSSMFQVVASVVSVPEEVCDLNPQKICRFTTKLVPKLTPQEECTLVPRETCHLTFSTPERGTKPQITKWCLDDSEEEEKEDTGGVAATARVAPGLAKAGGENSTIKSGTSPAEGGTSSAGGSRDNQPLNVPAASSTATVGVSGSLGQGRPIKRPGGKPELQTGGIARPVGPGARPSGPGARPVGPSARRTGQEARPVGPDVKPVGPGVRPIGTGARPVGPAVSPVVPGARPVGPGVRPVGLGARRVGPGARPLGPGARPVGQGARPGGSVAGPTGLDKRPVGPGTRPVGPGIGSVGPSTINGVGPLPLGPSRRPVEPIRTGGGEKSPTSPNRGQIGSTAGGPGEPRGSGAKQTLPVGLVVPGISLGSQDIPRLPVTRPNLPVTKPSQVTQLTTRPPVTKPSPGKAPVTKPSPVVQPSEEREARPGPGRLAPPVTGQRQEYTGVRFPSGRPDYSEEGLAPPFIGPTVPAPLGPRAPGIPPPNSYLPPLSFPSQALGLLPPLPDILPRESDLPSSEDLEDNPLVYYDNSQDYNYDNYLDDASLGVAPTARYGSPSKGQELEQEKEQEETVAPVGQYGLPGGCARCQTGPGPRPGSTTGGQHNHSLRAGPATS